PTACASTPRVWHIAMPSGESGIHPISGARRQQKKGDQGIILFFYNILSDIRRVQDLSLMIDPLHPHWPDRAA
ncbi:hypothetical protein, partial [Rhodobacter calidifons]|uniref:hypothetical protein n=1 Tax=Rhodobacter calidifons TaxID=2715277 RepID=UPI001A97F0DC